MSVTSIKNTHRETTRSKKIQMYGKIMNSKIFKAFV